MSKTSVYSWRLSPDRKAAIEDEARREGITVAEWLNRVTEERVRARRASTDDEREQARLHAVLEACIGSIHGGGTPRSERVQDLVRARLAARHARRRAR